MPLLLIRLHNNLCISADMLESHQETKRREKPKKMINKKQKKKKKKTRQKRKMIFIKKFQQILFGAAVEMFFSFIF